MCISANALVDQRCRACVSVLTHLCDCDMLSNVKGTESIRFSPFLFTQVLAPIHSANGTMHRRSQHKAPKVLDHFSHSPSKEPISATAVSAVWFW